MLRNFSLQPKRLVVAVILVSAAVTFGCESKINQPYSDTREVTDDLGRTVSVPNRIERAISLAPNLTEMIFAVGAGGKLVGATTFCNYPVEAQQIRKVSGKSVRFLLPFRKTEERANSNPAEAARVGPFRAAETPIEILFWPGGV